MNQNEPLPLLMDLHFCGNFENRFTFVQSVNDL